MSKGGVLQKKKSKNKHTIPLILCLKKKLYMRRERLEEKRQTSKNQLERSKLDSYWGAHRAG